MKKIQLIIVLLSSLIFVSCKKFLEEPPKKQADIKTADQLDALINNATIWALDGDNPAMAYSSDDTFIPTDVYKNHPSSLNIANLNHYVFAIKQVTEQSELFYMFWPLEFEKILRANIILFNIDKVSGGNAQKDKIKADAYFCRAYAYWNLANYYCLPYAPENLQSQGLPLKTSPAYDESIKRATLAQTYDMILSDITKARDLLTDADVTANSRWRISKPAIDAFLSRYYLFTGEYEKSIQHANTALNSTTAKLVDYKNILPGIAVNYSNPATTLKYSELNDWNAAKFLYWDEFYYTRFAYTANQWYIPSPSLLGMYDTANDLRYQLFMIPDGGRRFSVINPNVFRYTMFQDGRYLPTGPTRAEVLLNKAEASARLGLVTPALEAVNTLRLKRLKNYTALAATTPAEAINAVLQERRRELPFSFRWWDIRRFSVNAYPADDVTVSRQFFKLNGSTFDVNTLETYTLPVKSSRYMVPISNDEIINSQGQIEQNIYK